MIFYILIISFCFVLFAHVYQKNSKLLKLLCIALWLALIRVDENIFTNEWMRSSCGEETMAGVSEEQWAREANKEEARQTEARGAIVQVKKLLL